jgi:signal transduction histidine kinase
VLARAQDPGGGTGQRPPLRSRVATLHATVHLLVAVLVALLLVSGTATALARLTVTRAGTRLMDDVLPASQASTALTVAHVDQETGLRGFLLTGDRSFLEPYDRGRADAAALEHRLGDLLEDDPTGRVLLARATEAAQAWDTGAAQPQIDARSLGPLPAATEQELSATGRTLFDALRARLAALTDHTGQLTRRQLDRITAAETVANAVAVGTLVLAVVVALATVPLLRRRLTRPLQRLLTDVEAVAAGDHERPIDPQGPRELATIAAAVEQMRRSVLQHSRERVAVQHQLTLREEQDRMAADLHDLVIQRVFALGLGLSSVVRRHPGLAPAVAPLVDETDEVIRELRAVIFGLRRVPRPDETLRASVLDVTEASARALGFPPTVEFAGPLDAVTADEIAQEVLAVLREALSNVARHAGASTAVVRVAADDDTLGLTVTDDGRGVPDDVRRGDGLANLRVRAERLGGRMTVRPRPGGPGTVLEWEVPLRRDTSPGP